MTHARNRHRARREKKKGIVLLIIVTLLTLFIMIGITLTLLATNYKDASEKVRSAGTYGDLSEKEAEMALGQLLFGSTSLTAVSPHNFLADLYGHDSIRGSVQAVSSLNGNQIVNLTVNFTTTAETAPDYYSGRVFTFLTGNARGLSSRVVGYRYDTNSGQYYLAVEVPEVDLPVAPSVNVGDQFLINGAPVNGTGAGYRNADDSAPTAWAGMPRPRPAAPDSNHLDAFMYFENLGPSGQPPIGLPVSVLPNYRYYPPKPAIINFANGSPGPTEFAVNLGGMDENYDAADYQNMFLAMLPPSLGQGIGAGNRGEIVLLPSFHRPELVQMWFNYLIGSSSPITWNMGTNPGARLELVRYPYGRDCIRGNGDDQNTVSYMEVSPVQRDAIVALKRSIIFRPLREDHPGFTGGNFNFEPDRLTNNEDTLNFGNGNAPAPYDVDNDGDGIADSIWIDPGLPMVTTRDGRKYKRLVAYLVQDLDGRINLNVASSMNMLNVQAQASQQITDTFAGVDPMAPTPITLPRGLGFGPGEIDFRHIFSYDVNAFRSVITGIPASGIYGRYGADGGAPVPGPGIRAVDDTLSAVKNIGMPSNHTAGYSSYSSPPDVRGSSAMGLDYYGVPYWWPNTNAGTNETVDDPYEVQSDWRRASADMPYTPSEMEALLRYHDPGSQVLSSRLLSNSMTRNYLGSSSPGSLGADNRLRALISTMGTNIPAPPVVVPKELRQAYELYRQNNSSNAYQNWPASTSLLDLYAYRLRNGGVAQANLETEINRIVPFEFRRGQLLNINREFGNGQHDVDQSMPQIDIYGVVDDFASEPRYPASNPQNERIWGTTYFEHLNDYPQIIDPRQIMARHLYCLMMLLKDQNQHLDTDGDGAPNTALESARMIAQWAINAVDFRDADAILTPFEYDTNPWDGWQVDGNLTTDGTMGNQEMLLDANGMPVPTTTGQRDVVWGVERPELLLSEALAGHDRRTEDLANDDGSNGMPGMTPMDESFDQRLQPRGFLFVELYNPWFDRSNGNYDHKAPELYSATGGVELNRVNTQGSAVWRMLIVQGSLRGQDPDAPLPENFTNPPGGMGPNADVERSVYFAPQAAITAPAAGHGQPYYPPAGLTAAPILPGRYAVIGGADEVDTMAAPNRYITYMGRRTDAVEGGGLNLGNTRRIELRPDPNPATPQLRVFDNSKPYMMDPQDNDFVVGDVQPTVAIPITDPRSLSVSVPVGGYPANVGGSMLGPGADPNENIYAPTLDTPLDTTPELQQNVTTYQHRQIFLQRLANPLLAWNAVTNPYVTIDATYVDLTAFNGVAVDSADPQVGMNTRRNFQTRQRGGPFPQAEVSGYNYDPGPSRGYRNLWLQQNAGYGAPTADSPNGDPGGTGPHYFSYQLYHTLGYLNRRYWGPTGTPYFTAASGVPNYLGAPYHIDGEDNQPRAFPWLTHLDRPLTSPMELLNVPSQSSSQLLVRFQVQNSALPLNNAYNPNNSLTPYQHLLNFFQTTTNAATNDAPNLCRIFDYLEVPCHYVGAERYYNPTTFRTGTGNMNLFRPPFNKTSRFRDPGRININTIYDSAVWEAIAKTMPGMDPSANGAAFFQNLMASRQGYAGGLLTVNQNYPSLFSHPFRSADSADMMPPIPAGPNVARQPAAKANLLRSALAASDPLLLSNSTQAYEEAGRNPYFRYQGLQKVANMVTTRSNCFAVWVTVGYFEVEEVPGYATMTANQRAAWPDGYRLAQEVGADAGTAVRHRSFFIIDRSIPVAYEAGKRHNTDKAILLRRYIE